MYTDEYTKYKYIAANIIYWISAILMSVAIAVLNTPNAETLLSKPVLAISISVFGIIYAIILVMSEI